MNNLILQDAATDDGQLCIVLCKIYLQLCTTLTCSAGGGNGSTSCPNTHCNYVDICSSGFISCDYQGTGFSPSQPSVAIYNTVDVHG